MDGVAGVAVGGIPPSLRWPMLLGQTLDFWAKRVFWVKALFNDTRSESHRGRLLKALDASLDNWTRGCVQRNFQCDLAIGGFGVQEYYGLSHSGFVNDASFPIACTDTVRKDAPRCAWGITYYLTTSKKTTFVQVPPCSSDTHPCNYPIWTI